MPLIKYTEEQVARWAALYQENRSFGEIAAETGCNRSSIVHHLQRLGHVRRRKSGRKTKYAGLTAAQVRKQFWLKKLYRMTLAQFEALLAAQNGLCAICGRPPTEALNQTGQRGLHVDHDHATGKVRALLCSECNTGIGKFSDDPARLRAAADYLERHRAPEAA